MICILCFFLCSNTASVNGLDHWLMYFYFFLKYEKMGRNDVFF
ncbi:hypothetical protein D920_02883 [Enterococcus faecalis 13-SD-W-01]|nr:hypothetical protein D920_02883 [Enterococcus faecalis 13-SD-W-01]